MNEPNPDSKDSRASGTSRFRWFRTETISLADLIIQVFAVVLGILLALAISHWNQSRHQRETAALAMQAILDETSVNANMLDQRAAHLESMIADMDKSSANRQATGKKPCYEWEGWSGLQYPEFLDAAYQSSISTQALANMPFKQVENVAGVYSGLRTVQKVYDVDGGGMLLASVPQPLSFCTGLVREIANFDHDTTKGLARFMRQYGRLGTASRIVSGSP